MEVVATTLTLPTVVVVVSVVGRGGEHRPRTRRSERWPWSGGCSGGSRLCGARWWGKSIVTERSLAVRSLSGSWLCVRVHACACACVWVCMRVHVRSWVRMYRIRGKGRRRYCRGEEWEKEATELRARGLPRRESFLAESFRRSRRFSSSISRDTDPFRYFVFMHACPETTRFSTSWQRVRLRWLRVVSRRSKSCQFPRTIFGFSATYTYVHPI